MDSLFYHLNDPNLNEVETARLREAGDGYLAELEVYLQANGLSDKTVNRHVINASAFLDLLADINQPVEYGRLFLDEFFDAIASGHVWPASSNAKTIATSIKWLYASLASNKHISKQEYKATCSEIKSLLSRWQKTHGR